MSDYYRQPADADLGPLFRPSNPPTSAAAAAKVPAIRGEHAGKILAALEHGPAGQTEIARRSGLTVAQVSKRLHELRKTGAITRTGREVAGGECEYRRAT